MRRASQAERDQLAQTFASLCRIESPSHHERQCADWITAELRALGVEVEEDDAGSRTGSDAGNLHALIPGRLGQSLLICVHMDTVPLAAPVEPVLRDGGWENANHGILGADNKAAVAVALELARRLTAREEEPRLGLELLFTICEEVALQGAKAFDVSKLASPFGFVFDHASPIGEIVLASPTYYRVVAEVHGRAAHAGIRPEAGRSAIVAAARGISAMRVGRVDEQTTVNIGTIAGGSNANVVPEHCHIEAEVRSLDRELAEALATEVVDHFQEGADAAECDLDIVVERMFDGYRTRPGEASVATAQAALRACGYAPRHIATGGGSDANALRADGFPCTNIANGTERNHEPTERVSTDALEGMFEVAIALLEETEELPR